MLIFFIYFANSNNMSPSRNAIQILWSCAGVSKDTCPSFIFLPLSSSPLSLFYFFWTRNHEHDDSLPAFLFCFRRMTRFCMIVMTDGQCLVSCSWMIKVWNVHSITREAASLNKLKMYKIAMWNHKALLSYMNVALVVFEHESCHGFVFEINSSKSLN